MSVSEVIFYAGSKQRGFFRDRKERSSREDQRDEKEARRYS